MSSGNLIKAQRIQTLEVGTRAKTDAALVDSWLASLRSEHTRRNFKMTVERFRDALPMGLRAAKLEDVRDALDAITTGASEATARQYVLRVKSLLSFGHKLGYLPFNAGVTIKVRPDQSQARLAQRIVSEVEIGLLIRAASCQRDRVLLAVAYAGGLRVSELVALKWADVVDRDPLVQLSVTGKGGRVRQVLLPRVVSHALVVLRDDAAASDPLFPSRKRDANGNLGHLTEHTVSVMVKRTAKRVGITNKVSPHWLRHAHGSHALDRGATLAEVQATLGHANVATTSGYLHARPDSSSGLKLDPGIFR
jgi:integrase/recombinase XerD